jgi:hypothetical protein
MRPIWIIQIKVDSEMASAVVSVPNVAELLPASWQELWPCMAWPHAANVVAELLKGRRIFTAHY